MFKLIKRHLLRLECLFTPRSPVRVTTSKSFTSSGSDWLRDNTERPALRHLGSSTSSTTPSSALSSTPSLIAQYKRIQREHVATNRSQLEGMELAVWDAFTHLLRTKALTSSGSSSAVAFCDSRGLFIVSERLIPLLRARVTLPCGAPIGSDKKSIDRIIERGVERALISVLKQKNWLVRSPLRGLPSSEFWNISLGRSSASRVIIVRPPAIIRQALPKFQGDIRIESPFSDSHRYS